ncbi:MAG: tandem-95 repeat protein, partial [Dehalococcoidia bacterium]|nr:tandem-95 repeat protein [Dehalococcoidia bacterium]
TYTPDAGFVGTDAFSYTITDANGLTATADVTVTVTAAPVGSITVGEPTVNGQPAGTAPGPQVVSGSSITVTIEVTNSGQLEIVNLSGTSSIGVMACIEVVLQPGESTTCSVGGTVLSGQQQVSIIISGVAGGEMVTAASVAFYVGVQVTGPLAAPDVATTPQGTPVTINVLANDLGDGLTVTTVGTPSNGSVVINADGTVTYTPAAGFVGLDAFSYTITDEDGLSSSATVTVLVTPVMEPPPVGPLAVPDVATTTQGTPVTINVLANDLGDGLTVTTVGTPSNGSVVINADGTVTYAPAASFVGLDAFSYTITDEDGLSSSATVTVLVTPAGPGPSGPTAVPDVATTPQGTPVTINVLANDLGTGIEVTGASDPLNGAVVVNANGTITYTPAAAFVGVDSFSYTITDADGLTATATVLVLVTPTGPTDGGDGGNGGNGGDDDGHGNSGPTVIIIQPPTPQPAPVSPQPTAPRPPVSQVGVPLPPSSPVEIPRTPPGNGFVPPRAGEGGLADPARHDESSWEGAGLLAALLMLAALHWRAKAVKP